MEAKILILNVETFKTKDGDMLKKVTYGQLLETTDKFSGYAILETYVKELEIFKECIGKVVLAQIEFIQKDSRTFKPRIVKLGEKVL